MRSSGDRAPQRTQPSRTQQLQRPSGFPLLTSCTPHPAPGCAAHQGLAPNLSSLCSWRRPHSTAGPARFAPSSARAPPPLASCSQQAACGRSLRRAVRRTQGLVSQPLLCARGSDHTPQRAQPARTHSSASGHPGFPLPTSRTPQPAPGCVAHMLLYHVARR